MGGPRPGAGRPRDDRALLKQANSLAGAIREFLDVGAYKLGEAIPEMIEAELALANDDKTPKELRHKIRANLIRLGFAILQPPEAQALSKAAQVMRDILTNRQEDDGDAPAATVEMVESTGFDTRPQARDSGVESDSDGDSSI